MTMNAGDACGHVLDMECGYCHRKWCDKCTPTPGARCPFEYDHNAEVERVSRPRRTVWTYKGVTITKSAQTGYYLANTSRGLTADTLAGMRELIREFPRIN